MNQRNAGIGPLGVGASATATANCDAGHKAVGGGFANAVGFGRVDASRPELTSGVPTGWTVAVNNNSGVAGVQYLVYVVCASP